MKKFIALALAILMMAAIAVPVMAEDPAPAVNTANQVDKSAQTQVIFGTSDSYIVTVPQTVAFPSVKLATTATISASDVIIAGNKKLQVTIASASDSTNAGTAWNLVTTGADSNLPVEYAVSTTFEFADDGLNYDSATNVCTNGSVVLEVLSNQKGTGEQAEVITLGKSATLYFGTKGTTQSGNYTDTLTFTTALVAYTPSQG